MFRLSRFSRCLSGEMRRHCSIWTAVILFLCPFIDRGQGAPSDPRHSAERKKLELWTAALPMQFEANAGQTDSQVKFLARGPGYQVFLTPTQAVLSLVTTSVSKAEKLAVRRGERQPAEAHAQRADLRMTLLGANRQPQIQGADRLPGIANYFIGNDPSRWHTEIPTFNKVKYERVYRDIDLVYYGNQRQLEYDFIVGPGASPERIAFNLEGADRLEVDEQGNLIAHVGNSTVQWHKPFAYQELNGARQEVPAGFVVDNGRVSFDVAHYDTSRPLVIDPYVVYSTYFGGSGDDFLGSITVDTSGNLYVIGDTSSLNFPITNAYDGTRNGTNQSVVVTKISPGGSNLVFSTYVGGSTNDYSGDIALDPSGNIYITGQTYSSDFPMKNAAQATKAAFSDIFVAKLGPAGTNLLYSTYWGGPQDEAGMCIAADKDGDAYVSGWTYSARNFPVSANRFQSKAGGYPQDNNRDAFVLKFRTTASGFSSLLLASWLGGSTDETGYGIAVDSANNIYVAGIVDDGPYATFTSPPTSDFPVTAGAFQTQFDNGSTNIFAGFTDGFLTKITSNSTYSVVFSTFIGGSDEDNCWGVVLDANNRPYVVGETASQDFPITANALQSAIGGGTNNGISPQDAFVTEFQNTGASLLYSTYLGGSSYESGFGEFHFSIALDRFGAIYVTGNTESDDFPLTSDADQTDSTAQSDAFISKINPAVPGPNGLVYSTLLGGNGDVQFGNAANYGMAIAVDTNGNMYVGGMTSATNFPFTPGAFGTNHNGGYYDMILAKYSSPPDLSVTMSPSIEPVLVGSNLTYSIQVNNNGYSTFHGVTNTLQLPTNAQLTAVSSTAPWTTNNGALLFNIGTLTNNASITQLVTVVPLAVTNLSATATVTQTEPDPNPLNNTATVLSTVRGIANIIISNSAAPNPVLVTSNITYTITVSNAGPWAATSLVVTDALPAAVSFVSATTSQGISSANGNVVTFSLGVLPTNRSATLTITATTVAAGTFLNTAGASFYELDPVIANNSASASVTINPLADLSLAMTQSANPSFVGSVLTYTNLITNSGPSTASSVMLTNFLPAGATFLSAHASQGTVSQASGIVTASLGSISSNGTASVTISVTNSNPGTFTNNGLVSSAATDLITTNNSASIATTVYGVADIRVANSVAPNPVLATSNLTYTITVSNAGPWPATSLVVTDTLPASMQFVSATTSQGGWSTNGNAVTFTVGTLPVAGSATLTITATAMTDGTFNDTAGATLTELDPFPTNNSASASVTIIPVADLSVAIIPSLNPAYVGSTLVYTNFITNSGPSTAAGVVLTNFLDPGVSFVSAQSSQGSVSQSNGIVTASLGSISGSGFATVTITVTTPTLGTFTNSALVSSAVIDLNTNNNSASIATAVYGIADVSVAESVAPNPVSATSNLTYTITVSNAGPWDATSLVVTDTLPAAVQFLSATASQGAWSTNGSTVSFTLGTLPTNNSATLTITAAAVAAGTFTNTAGASANEFDPVTTNNSAGASVTINPLGADLALAMTQSLNPVFVGSTLVYTNIIRNAGPSTATSVLLTNFLPAGVTFVSAQSSQGSSSQSSGVVVTTLGTIASNGVATVKITVTTPNAGTFTNNALVTSAVPDLVLTNNSASISTTVNPSADLSLAMTQSLNPALVGSTLVYTNTVSNSGPSAATGVLLTNFLPAGVTFVSAQSSQGSSSQSSGVVVTTLGTIASNGLATVKITVTTPNAGTFTNNAVVTSAVSDPVPANNSASITTTVNSSADLSLALTQSLNSVNVGSTLVYTNTVSNLGPSTATGVLLTNFLPAGVTFVSAQSSQGSSSQSSGVVVTTLGTIASNGVATVQITVTTLNAGTFTNNALVTSAVADPVTVNNSASVTTTINPVADVSLAMASSMNPSYAGSTLIYTNSVRNLGPSTATNVVLTNFLPAGVTFVSAQSSQGSVSQANGIVSASLGSISSNGAATVTITVTMPNLGTFTNNALVNSPVTDPIPANNSASVATTVYGVANVGVSNSVAPNSLFVGSNLTYTIVVTNPGPWPATALVVTDTLPAAISFVSATTSQGSWSINANTVTFNLGALPTNSTARLTITATAAAPGTFIDIAAASFHELDPLTATNSASGSASVTINALADLSLAMAPSLNPSFVGSTLVYTNFITNSGPSTATSVVLTNFLPAGVTFVSAQSSQGSVSQNSGIVSASLGAISSNGIASVTVTVTTPNLGTFTNNGIVTSTAADLITTNNSASVVTPVYGFADLSVSLSVNTNSVMIRSNVTFTITVSNAGPYNASGVSLTNTVDGSFHFTSVQPSQGTSTILGGFACDLGSFAIGSNVTIIATAAATADGTFTNIASISANESESNPANNTASVTISVADDPQKPYLRISLAGTNAILTWTTNATGFVLQKTSPALPGNSWTTTTNPPGIVGTRYSVTNPMVAPNSFYRLSK